MAATPVTTSPTSAWTPTTDEIEALVTYTLAGDDADRLPAARAAFSRWRQAFEADMRAQVTRQTARRRIAARRATPATVTGAR